MTSKTQIRAVKLGMNGPTVGAQGLGAMAMATDIYGATDESESMATLNHALDRGVTLIDTADMYGNGANETFLGPFVRANRDRVVLATKFGFFPHDDPAKGYFIDNRPEYIFQAAEASLRRLGIETIDIYYMHRRNRKVPLEDSVGAMADLVASGKVRYIGLSEVTGEELRLANSIHPIAALESEWSLFSRDVEESVVPAAAELNIAFVPYSPLGRGMLTGTVKATALEAGDVRNVFPRFAGEHIDANARLVSVISTLAQARGVTPAQIAMAWVHGRATVHGLTVVPIPGTRKRSRLDENLAAIDVHLTDDELKVLEPLGDAVQGIRPVFSDDM
ncbi:aryl-alcohol dehydrogenase-like predicted oxidoreductase [Phyllobacterium endophyticum]|uniref:Aldo/keto reductase n=1 Tax=Phyllobacterium endophyticum TaxID=1149773 RepID=A0A2P7ASF4_9HYPH|nr:aldo/keto reductase [Phyllobacterium endophyticum]MBB3236839.1 aryl-alcohol dehydrogenase-like predicted oxidoreductase [Phyllobacterium endophyticum]PSH57103.1 aldo/keto reductase [Phyllobacterium endophyticum]TYR40382.1 aldo/keto reductase [Phyllobacterium endophyticum]